MHNFKVYFKYCNNEKQIIEEVWNIENSKGYSIKDNNYLFFNINDKIISSISNVFKIEKYENN